MWKAAQPAKCTARLVLEHHYYVVQATLEWENQDDGFLAKILVGDGSKDIPVGTPVAVITDEKDDVSLATPCAVLYQHPCISTSQLI